MPLNVSAIIEYANQYMCKIAVISDPKLQELSKLPTYAARTRFAHANWPRLRAGSGRVVYDYSPDLVLKLAKNEKGVQQNITESDGFIQDHYKSVVANVIDSDPDDTWMVVEKASRITPTEFRTMTGINIKDLSAYLRYKLFGSYIPDDLKEKMEKNEWVQDIFELARNFDMPAGDLERISSWGKIGNRVVLVDYGLTQSIFEEYYK